MVISVEIKDLYDLIRISPGEVMNYYKRLGNFTVKDSSEMEPVLQLLYANRVLPEFHGRQAEYILLWMAFSDNRDVLCNYTLDGTEIAAAEEIQVFFKQEIPEGFIKCFEEFWYTKNSKEYGRSLEYADKEAAYKFIFESQITIPPVIKLNVTDEMSKNLLLDIRLDNASRVIISAGTKAGFNCSDNSLAHEMKKDPKGYWQAMLVNKEAYVFSK